MMGVKTHEVMHYNTTDHFAWYVWCPACDEPHSFDKRWTFDGNHNQPTFTPSMLVRWNAPATETEPKVAHVCHSFLESGVWRFLDDCTHNMKGTRQPAPDWAGTRYGRPASGREPPGPSFDGMEANEIATEALRTAHATIDSLEADLKVTQATADKALSEAADYKAANAVLMGELDGLKTRVAAKTTSAVDPTATHKVFDKQIEDARRAHDEFWRAQKR